MKHTVLACAVLALSLFFTTCPTYAKKKQTGNEPDVTITLSEEAQKTEKEFERALKKLDSKQKAFSQEMEVKFIETVEPDRSILELASQIDACGYEGAKQKEVMEQFNSFRDRKNEEQLIMWGTFVKKYYPMVDFMDHDLLKKHLAIVLNKAMDVSAKMIAIRAAQFDKELQCERAQETLKTFANEDG